mgnify:CR=1 FL=1
MIAKDDSLKKNTFVVEEWVRHKAKSIGFLEMASLPLIDSDPGFPTYEHWLQAGYHQPLDYMARNKSLRLNPQELEPDLKSAFVFLHPYPQDNPSKMIARYAWGNDYHFILKDKLRQLSSSFQKEHGLLVSERICVDTAPILERSIAQRSGLGWIAKNGCLISRQHGSWFLIATWLTSLPCPTPPVDQPSFHCGKCTRCIDACPTNAFVQPGMLDAKRCLSTQTIENRGSFPTNMIGKMEEQAFGCDICQEVCPWNTKHPLPIKEDFLPDLNTLLSIPEAQFRDYFRKTPMERPTWAGLRRNFLVLSADRDDVLDTTISKHLKDERVLVRQTARDVLDYRKRLRMKPSKPN